ncbi:MAG: hypothetical protein ACK5LC_03770 [Coprobacillaceae bacterium]
MEKKLILEDMEIVFSETTPKEIIEKGYHLDNVEQILEEPTITGCELCKGNKRIANLYFYNIKREVTLEELYNIEIDFVGIQNRKPKKKTSVADSFIKKLSLCIWSFTQLAITLIFLFSLYHFNVI